MSAKDSELLDAFHANFRIQDRRRVDSLPKKQSIAMPKNKMNAAYRLRCLRDRLDHKEALKEIHHAQMIHSIATCKWK
jgi:hypothetical protein